MRCSVVFGSISVLFSGSAVKVHDSQAYRIVNLTRKRIGFSFDPRDILLSLYSNRSATNANLSIIFFQSIRHNPFEKNVEEDG